MEWIFFGAFSVVAAMLFNFAYPKIQAMEWAQKAGGKGFIGITLVTASAFFVVLIVASFLMATVIRRPSLPA